MTASVVMVQGTASHVGKSVVTAGLCRLLQRRGVRVAPFKALNLSLNAAVTSGGEIARSTAVQAAAARIEPTVDMNPILLKPEAGNRSQVILRGKVHGTLQFGGRESVLDYWPVVTASLDRLRARYDIVVAEGAGSPAEMNLRDHDVANMRVALHASAAVILVGDIERGGVFAQLIGTLELLPPEERALVRGLIVNRFHGDPGLFTAGVSYLEQRTQLPVFGVVPFVRDIDLPEEDAANLDRPGLRVDGDEPAIRIAVIRLPHLANFDDFGPLERLPGVGVSYVDRPGDLAGAAMVVLPGSKSTIADLQFVRDRGLADAILALRANGTPIVGICGGFQMLGRWIDDPDHVESAVGGVAGLGLLPHSTVFEREKVTKRVRARFLLDLGPFGGLQDDEIEGYEIHHGRIDVGSRARINAPLRIVERSGARADDLDGAISDDGLVFGTYLHGFFDNDRVSRSLQSWLASRQPHAAMGPLRPISAATHFIDPYDRWADVIEEALNLELLFERCGLSLPKRGAP
ncbi:MAG TPA: cobyric acid synthase [Chloroflexota bacterium]|nr:cobyric acid synthase [Chloroflexota bacterium]